MKIKRLCAVCKYPFYTSENRIINGRGKYCSKKCQFKGMYRRVPTRCGICKKEFLIRESRKNRNKRNYCSKKCLSKGLSIYTSKHLVKWIKDNKGFDKNILGKKGKAISIDGYYVFNGVKIHRLLMEKHLERKLLSTEIIHHIDFNKLNNKLDNLLICSRSEHNKIHKFLHKRPQK